MRSVAHLRIGEPQADPAINSALVPIAEAVLAAPGAQWWSEPLARSAQVRTTFEPAPAELVPGRTHVERLRRWREDRGWRPGK